MTNWHAKCEIISGLDIDCTRQECRLQAIFQEMKRVPVYSAEITEHTNVANLKQP